MGHKLRTTSIWFCGLISMLFLGFSISNANAIEFDLPVRCEMGKTCFIQNYVDHQVGDAYKDYRCGHLSYDNHTGTDFRVVDESIMAKGIPVIAAASGYVIGTRDGEPDIAITLRGKNQTIGKEAGNGVVIDHGQGWQSQYGHLRKGSVLVKRGDWVEIGQPIGLIGESGNADFPHVEFLVRKDGRPIDPFLPDQPWSCDPKIKTRGLWSTAAIKSLPYIDTVILQTGFSEQIPTRFQFQSGQAKASSLQRDVSQFVLWAEVMGPHKGDRWRFEITDPNGKKILDTEGENQRDRAIIIIGAGKKLRPGSEWPAGIYAGSFSLIRDETVYLARQTSITLQ